MLTDKLFFNEEFPDIRADNVTLNSEDYDDINKLLNKDSAGYSFVLPDIPTLDLTRENIILVSVSTLIVLNVLLKTK